MTPKAKSIFDVISSLRVIDFKLLFFKFDVLKYDIFQRNCVTILLGKGLTAKIKNALNVISFNCKG